MAKLQSSLLNMVLSLGITTVVAAVLLGGVYMLTKDTIASAERKAQIDAIKEVAPEFDNNPVEDKFSYTENVGTKDSVTFVVFPAVKAGEIVGAAVEGVSMNGFGGEIRVMYGFEKDGTVRGFRVLKHTETAGLGAKMQDWFSHGASSQNIIGHNPRKENMTVAKDGGVIDGITAATITSRAFLDAMNGAFAAYQIMIEKQMKQKGAKPE